MKSYSFIDPEQEYDVDELWNKLGDIGSIMKDYYECEEKLRVITGDIFRTEEERKKYLELMNEYQEGKDNVRKIFEDISPEQSEQFKNNLKQLISIANIQRAAHRDKSLIYSLINGVVSFSIKHAKVKTTDGTKESLPEVAKKLILSAYLFTDTGIHIYNNLLASLAITKTELEVQTKLAETGKNETRFVWHHNGLQISFQYAVAMLMADLDALKFLPSVSEAINVFSDIIPDTDMKAKEDLIKAIKKTQQSRDKVFTDIKNIYGNYTQNEIERQGDKLMGTHIFKYLGLKLPDEETIDMAMESEYEMAVDTVGADNTDFNDFEME